jgi:hypothetical protein
LVISNIETKAISHSAAGRHSLSPCLFQHWSSGNQVHDAISELDARAFAIVFNILVM